MAYVKTVIVAAALVALCAELSTAACICSCGSARRQYAADVAAAGAGDEYASASASSGEASSDSWTNIPSNAVITSSSYNDDSCGRCEIRMPDEAPLPIGIVQHRPTCAQHLSYNIEVPVEQAKPIVPSYHSVSVEVPIRQKQSVSFSHLPYSVEVPVENAPCQKLENLNVQIAVPVRERQTVSYSHLPYSVEVPVEKHGSRLTNLKAQVDRVVLPHRETCLPPNNGPAPTAEVHYVAVPAIGPCPSPISLLGLPKSSATFNYDVSSGVVASGASGSSSGSRYVPLGHTALGIVDGAGQSSEEDEEEDSEEDSGEEEEEEQPNVVRAGRYYSEPEEEGRGKRVRRAVLDAEGEEEVVEGSEGVGVDGGSEEFDEKEAAVSVADGAREKEVAEVGVENDLTAGVEEEGEVSSSEVVDEDGEGAGEDDEEEEEEDAELDPALAAAAEDGEEAGALNKRMCNSQSMRRAGGGGRRVITAVRLADDCQGGQQSDDGPTRFYLDTYQESCDQSRDFDRSSQSSPCACSCGRESVPRAFSSSGSTCSVWRPQGSAPSSTREGSSCDGGSGRGMRRARARGQLGQGQGQGQGQCPCGARGPQSCTCSQRSRSSSRRSGPSQRFSQRPNQWPAGGCRMSMSSSGGRPSSSGSRPSSCGCNRPHSSSSSRDADDSHLIIAPYRIPEDSVRSLINQRSSCGCRQQQGSGGRSRGCGRASQSSRIVNEGSGGAGSACKEGDESRILANEEGDYYDEDYDNYDDYDGGDDLADERALPAASEPGPCTPCMTRRWGYHDMVRAAQRDHACNSASVGPRTILVHNMDSGLAPMNRDGLCDCGASRDMPRSSSQCGDARDLPAPSCQSGSARDMPAPSCQCGSTRDMPAPSCQCGAARDVPRSSSQCGDPRNMPAPSCECGAARDLPAPSSQSGSARDMPAPSCQCGSARDMPAPSCQCGSARDMPAPSRQCGAGWDPAQAASLYETLRALLPAPCQCGTSSPCESSRSGDPCESARSSAAACECGAAARSGSDPCTCASPSVMCPVCGKGLRAEHVDHIVRCLQEARDQVRAAEQQGACAQPARSDPVMELQSHALVIPIPVLRSSALPVATPCPEPAAVRTVPCPDPAAVRTVPCPVPACRSSCGAPADTRSSSASSASATWVRDWIEQVSRALADPQQSGGCAACGAQACSCCRGGRSIRPEDIPEDLQKDIPEELRNGADGRGVEEDAVERAGEMGGGTGEGERSEEKEEDSS